MWLGSYWAFSSTAAIESMYAIATGDLVSLSEQQLINCDSTNYGCNGGYMDYAFEWVMHNGGLDSEANCPYTAFNDTCIVNKVKFRSSEFLVFLCFETCLGALWQEENRASIDGYQNVAQDDSALLCAVVQQPLSVGIHGSALDFQLYTGVS